MTPPLQPPSSPSLLERLLDILQASGSLRICFDDLSGITMDYPEFRLPEKQQIHDSPHCWLAKTFRNWKYDKRLCDCAFNKRATNSIAMRRGCGFHGLCHLGLFDVVEPLIYRGTTLGVFYYGQVSVRQWKAKSQRRIRQYCERLNQDPKPLLETFKKLPSIDVSEIPIYQERLKTVVETTYMLCESLAVLVDRYRINLEAVQWRFLVTTPPLIRAVGDYVSKHYDEPCRVSDLAQRFHCHPNYLGALFRKSTGHSLNDFVNNIRIEHAKHLLQVGRFGVSEIGFKCGFSDPSHFGKIFRQLAGMTPLAYRTSLVKSQAKP